MRRFPGKCNSRGKTPRWNAIIVFEKYLRNKTIGSKGDIFSDLGRDCLVCAWLVGWLVSEGACVSLRDELKASKSSFILSRK